MDRRSLLAGAGAALVAASAGCLGGSSDSASGTSPRTDGANGTERFLAADETPESGAARAFLATVREETDGLYRFTDEADTERKGFRQGERTWELLYYGTPHTGDERFREEIAVLATAFASHRPDGVSLSAESYHECTTGTWRVTADTAAAYDAGELDRETFLQEVYETAEVVNDC